MKNIVRISVILSLLVTGSAWANSSEAFVPRCWLNGGSPSSCSCRKSVSQETAYEECGAYLQCTPPAAVHCWISGDYWQCDCQ